MSFEQATGPLRVAIVGLGPKGLFALEHLLDEVSRGDGGASIEVDVFEPHPAPGAGPIYDPAQPPYLRMNLAAGRISVWHEDSRAAPPSQQLSLIEWQRAEGEAEPYPPRSLVGRYLTEALETLLGHAPDGAAVRVRPESVARLGRNPEGWALEGEGWSETYDEVLLTPGHQSTWEQALANDWRHRASLVPAVFPPEQELPPQRVPAGSRVAMRGFALTFIDACLALTEGRGGRFAQDGSRLRYVAGGHEPAVILPFSRGGRPMLAKPDPEIARRAPGLEAIGEDGSARILGLAAGTDLLEQVLEIVAGTARACLIAGGGEKAEAGSAQAWVEAAAAGALPAEPDPRDRLEHSLRVGCGELAVDLPWALAQSWLLLYPALSMRLAGDGLDPAGWPRFRNLVREMERITFGPPPANGEKLLALIDCGLIDLAHVAGGRLSETADGTVLASEAGANQVDVVVDAVLPGPGVGGSHRALFAEAIESGWARVADGRRGIEIDDDATCIGHDGRRSAGLATVGRSTEDWVIDNDTLTRDRHPHLALWAGRVAGRAASRARPQVHAR